VPHTQKQLDYGSSGLIGSQMTQTPAAKLMPLEPPERSSGVHLTMTNLDRRLKKLEALRTDSSGLIPTRRSDLRIGIDSLIVTSRARVARDLSSRDYQRLDRAGF